MSIRFGEGSCGATSAFSNGSSEAVEEVLQTNGLREWFAGVVSCDSLKTFKPNPDVYHYFMREAGDSNDALLISGNPFDVIGAVSAGMKSAWVKRSDRAVFDPWGIEPSVTVDTLSELCVKVDSRLKASVTSQNQQWASRQLADYDARLPGTMFAEGVVLDVAQGYELQSAVAQLRCGRGERVIGYKVGCTSPTIRAQLGINHCVSGRLYDSEQHSSGTVLSRKEFASLAIEGELAVELSREPNEKEFSEVEIPACVARVFPVIELHNHVMRGERPSAGELIANNAIHAGVVAGSCVRLTDICGERSLDSAALSIFADDRLLDECAGPALIQTINSSLKWLTESVRDRGERLRAGQIILTESIPSLIPIAEDCGIRVDAPPFGSVEVKFTP